MMKMHLGRQRSKFVMLTRNNLFSKKRSQNVQKKEIDTNIFTGRLATPFRKEVFIS